MSIMKTITTLATSAILITATPVFADNTTITPDKGLLEYNERYNAIAADYDMDAFVALYNANPLWVAPGKEPVAGLEVPRNTFGFLAKNNGKLTHTADHTFVSKDGSQAVLMGRYDINVESKGVKGAGTYLFVMKRNGTEWDIVVDMYNQHAQK